MKNFFQGVALIIALIVVIAAGQILGTTIQDNAATKGIDLGGSYVVAQQNLVGDVTDAIKLPASYVEADATTTDAVIDGGLVNQLIRTDGIDVVRLNIAAVGGTATSTLNVKPQVSYDGVTFYQLMYSTSTPNIAGNGTTTPTVAGYVTGFDPGTATTTWSYDYNISGAKWVRFLLLGDDLATDPDDGVQAWIEAQLIDASR